LFTLAGQFPPPMQKYYHRFLQSAVAIPILATQLVLSPVSGANAGFPTAAAISPDQNRPLSSEVADNKQLDPDEKALVATEAKKIDAYFGQYDLPMEGEGYKLAEAAVVNGLPPASLAAIAFNESTADKFGCSYKDGSSKNNPFGYGSCKISFDSMDEAIDTVAETLAGKIDATARFYQGKTFEQKLRIYNGYGANAHYVPNVKYVMAQIDQMDIADDSGSTTTSVATAQTLQF